MVEYGQVVGQQGSQLAGGAGRAVGGGPTLDGSIVDQLTGVLDHTAAALGVSPAILLLALFVAVVFLVYLALAR